MADDDFCYVTTTGRVTGRRHEIEIWYVRHGDAVYLMAGGGRSSDWVRNLARDPRATVRIGDDTFEATARLLDDASPEAARVRGRVFDKYQPRYAGSLASWRERALPVVLDLLSR